MTVSRNQEPVLLRTRSERSALKVAQKILTKNDLKAFQKLIDSTDIFDAISERVKTVPNNFRYVGKKWTQKEVCLLVRLQFASFVAGRLNTLRTFRPTSLAQRKSALDRLYTSAKKLNMAINDIERTFPKGNSPIDDFTNLDARLATIGELSKRLFETKGRYKSELLLEPDERLLLKRPNNKRAKAVLMAWWIKKWIRAEIGEVDLDSIVIPSIWALYGIQFESAGLYRRFKTINNNYHSRHDLLSAAFPEVKVWKRAIKFE
jgi:hypothetical protein